MASIANYTSGQDLFIAAFNQAEPEQKKQMCRELKEMFPDHPVIAQIAKVSHLLNWTKTERMIANSQIKYLEGLSTPEIAMAELLWNSYMGHEEIERGNLLLFRILESSNQHELKSKLAHSLSEKKDTLGLSAPALAFMQAAELNGPQGYSDQKQALALYDKVIKETDSPSDLISLAKFNKAIILQALIRQNGALNTPQSNANVGALNVGVLDLYNQIINDEHASHDIVVQVKQWKAIMLHYGKQGVQMDPATALDLYNQLINDEHAPPDLIARAKYLKALLLDQGGQGIQVDQVAALDLYNQVINDKHAPPNFIAQTKYWKAFLLHHGGQGVQIDQAAALDLYNQVINDKHAPPDLVAGAKFRKVQVLRDSNALSCTLLKAAYATRNTLHWQEVLTLLRATYGGESFPSLTTPEERFYLMLLLESPETIINHLKEHGRPPLRFGGGMKSFLTYLLTSDLPDFGNFQTQVLEAIRKNFPSLLTKIDLNLNARETLSRICYEGAIKYGGEFKHELSNWFYEQIPFGSSHYAAGLEGVFMLYSNLALSENSSSIHQYKTIKYIKKKIIKYSHHLKTKQNVPQAQKDIMNALIRQIDEIKNKAKEELKTQVPTPSLMTEQVLQLMEVRDTFTTVSSKCTENDATLDNHAPQFSRK
jgi:TPR repeat protein